MEAATLDPPKGAETQDSGDPEDRQELVIDAGGQLSFAVGGKRPTGSSLVLTGGKFRVDGQLDKGEALTVTITRADGSVLFEGAAVVNQVAFKDVHDSKTSQVVGCQRDHRARIAAG